MSTVEVVVPTSPDEAVSSFGDGHGVTVVGGGTIVMPDLTYGRLKPERVLLLARAGLDQIRRDGSTVRIGAGMPLSAIAASAPEPLRTAAERIGDYEIRGQATIGGNLCALPGGESPRGDLQAPLIVLAASIRSVGAGGEGTESVEDFLEGRGGRLVLEIAFEEPKRGVYTSLGRPHAHAYTVLSVACAEGKGGITVAVGGAGARAVRARSVEQALADGASPEEAAENVLDDVEPQDDALASAWYRRRVLPTLVAEALSDLAKERA